MDCNLTLMLLVAPLLQNEKSWKPLKYSYFSGFFFMYCPQKYAIWCNKKLLIRWLFLSPMKKPPNEKSWKPLKYSYFSGFFFMYCPQKYAIWCNKKLLIRWLFLSPMKKPPICAILRLFSTICVNRFQGWNSTFAYPTEWGMKYNVCYRLSYPMIMIVPTGG